MFWTELAFLWCVPLVFGRTGKPRNDEVRRLAEIGTSRIEAEMMETLRLEPGGTLKLP